MALVKDYISVETWRTRHSTLLKLILQSWPFSGGTLLVLPSASLARGKATCTKEDIQCCIRPTCKCFLILLAKLKFNLIPLRSTCFPDAVQTWKMSETLPEQDCSFPDFTRQCVNYINFKITTKQRNLSANTMFTTFTG